MRPRITTLVADEGYPSEDLLEGGVEVPTLSLVAIDDDAIPVQAVDDAKLAEIAARVAAEFFTPLLDGRSSMRELSEGTGLDLDIVRAAIVRLAAQGAVTFIQRPRERADALR